MKTYLYNAGTGWGSWFEAVRDGDAVVTDGASYVSITATTDSSHTFHFSPVFDTTGYDFLKASIDFHGVPKELSIDLSTYSGNGCVFGTFCESDIGFQSQATLALTSGWEAVPGARDVYTGSESTTDVKIYSIWLETTTTTPTVGTKYALPAYSHSV